MQQIAHWLEKLGMSEYAERFAENKIDVSVLRHLTDQDLKDIGVALGHRRKILAAITEFADAAPAVSKPVLAAEPKTRDSAERRQVTVTFFRLGWFDGTLGANGPRGPSRGHFRLSEVRHRDCAALRRVRGKVHGRRRPGVFRLSPGARARRRARGASGAGVDRGGRRIEGSQSAANPRRHRYWARRRWRPDRIG